MKTESVSLGRDFARALDPVLLARDCGIDPDSVQAGILTSTSRRILLNCTRQFGKSTCSALIALHASLYQAPSTIILISPSQPQSTELFKRMHQMWSLLPGAAKATQESLTRLQLDNGSRVISLPGSEKTARGYTADLVVVDEASRCPDELFAAVRPMLATKADGRFIALSTPAGKRGFFYEQWTNGEGWERVTVRGADCPRISKEFLEEERQALGPLRFSQEYETAFVDSETSVFNSDLIQQALTNDFSQFFAA
ncbi:MAG: terminase family protein [Xanthobacteraceae bacterium]